MRNVQNVKTTTVVFDDKKKKNAIIGAVIALVIAVCLAMSITVVQAGHTGVITTFGKVSENVLQEGIHMKAPWQKITKIDNRIVKLTVDTDGSTKDLQQVNTELAVNYRVDSSKSYYIIKNVGRTYEDTLVTPATNEVLKAVMAKYSAEECITNRASLSTEIIQSINEKLNKQGIFVEDINIVNFNFSAELNAAIEAKQVAEQNKLKAETEKEQTIIEAEAAAEKKTIAAKANADAILIEAKAEAEANELLNKSLSNKVINYEAVQKWNGELPKVNGSSGTFVNFSDLAGTTEQSKE